MSEPSIGSHAAQPAGSSRRELSESQAPLSASEAASVAETSRLALLDATDGDDLSAPTLLCAGSERVRSAAVRLLGGESTIGRPIRGDEDLIRALGAGFPAQVLRELQDAGYPHKVLEQVIAPRRTLMRRRGEGQRLICEESDAAWRLAHALALAEEVLNGRQAALAWLLRPKPALDDQSPVDLLRTSVGAAYLEHKLRELDWGDVA